MSGPALGRPMKDREAYREMMKSAWEDEVARIPIEGVFGNGKRKYGMALVKAKLRRTSETWIALSVLVLNLDRLLRVLFCLLLVEWAIRLRVCIGLLGTVGFQRNQKG